MKRRHVKFLDHKWVLKPVLTAGAVLILIGLSGCGYGQGDKVKIDGRPGGKTDKDDPVEKVSQPLPALADDDLRLLAMAELTRIYRTSKILLAGEQNQDRTLNCIAYRRVKTGNQFLRATYDKCAWEHPLGGQILKWVMGATSNNIEIFMATPDWLMARLKADIAAQFDAPAALTDAEDATDLAADGKRRAHKNIYERQVAIQFPKDKGSASHPLRAYSGIGLDGQTKIDYVRTVADGYWNVQSSKIVSGQIAVTITYRAGTAKGKKELTRIVFTPSAKSELTFEGAPCERPKGGFIWSKLIDGQKTSDNGEFDVDKDGVVDRSGTRPILRWPKSCMEFQTPAGSS